MFDLSVCSKTLNPPCAGLVGLASMGVYWTFSLFFVVAELWGGVAISMLFW